MRGFLGAGAWILRRRGELDKTIARSRKEADLYREARSLIEVQKWEEAKRKLDELLVVNPLNTEAKVLYDRLRQLQADAIKSNRATRSYISDPPELIAQRARNAPRNMVYVPGGYYRMGSDKGDPAGR